MYIFCEMLYSILLFMGIGTPELLVILFAILLLFGGNKLPELARGLGKGIREFKDASDGVKREFHRNIDAIGNDLDVDSPANKPLANAENNYTRPEQMPQAPDTGRFQYQPEGDVTTTGVQEEIKPQANINS